MPRLRFDAPEHSPQHLFEVGGKTYGGGDEDEFSKDVADRLLADPHVPVSVVKPSVETTGATEKEVKT